MKNGGNRGSVSKNKKMFKMLEKLAWFGKARCAHALLPCGKRKTTFFKIALKKIREKHQRQRQFFQINENSP